MLVPDVIWFCDYQIKFGSMNISARMTIVRLSNNRLWVHSPMLLDKDLKSDIDALGQVSCVVAPNLFHHLFFKQFMMNYPNANGYITSGLEIKSKELSTYSVIEDQLWANDFESIFIDGLPIINETVFFHKSSKTLIITDLLFCFGTHAGLVKTLIAKILGVHNQLAMSRIMKLMVKDKKALKQAVSIIQGWNMQRIILAHDQIITTDAHEKFVHAFSWLR